MYRPVVLGCVLLAACEPVLLVASEGERPESAREAPGLAASDGGAEPDAADAEPSTAGGQSSGAGAAQDPVEPDAPKVLLSVKSIDCGGCFDLTANGEGGTPPYRYEWDDGSRSPTRRVCLGSDELKISVVVEDTQAARSTPYVTLLEADVAACSGATSSQLVRMCLMNPSFEGMAAINTGAQFDAIPWSMCVDPMSDIVSNTPDIANATLDPMTGVAPSPVDGDTYLAMRTAEIASQQLCQPLTAGSRTYLQLDAVRMNIGSPEMFLQLWGGSSATCSQRQLLWVSPVLETSWNTYCVPIEPGEWMDQITLRAETPTPDLVVNYLAVDNLVPVDDCDP
jgi:hypothetical protein